MNPELQAVWDQIPQRAAAEKALADIRTRKAAIRPAHSPDDARNEVINAAVTDVVTGAPWPKDLGKRAATAYTDALAANAEWSAVCHMELALVAALESVQEVYSEDALALLGSRLDGILNDVNAIVARSGHITTGDAAIAAGGTAVEDYQTLLKHLKTLSNIRDAQRKLLAPPMHTPAPELSEAYRRGHDEVRGLRTEPAPSHIAPMMLNQAPQTVEYLVWLAASGRAYVPTSGGDLLSERLMPSMGIPDGPVHDFSPRVLPPAPEPEQPVRTGFERNPNITQTVRTTT